MRKSVESVRSITDRARHAAFPSQETFSSSCEVENRAGIGKFLKDKQNSLTPLTVFGDWSKDSLHRPQYLTPDYHGYLLCGTASLCAKDAAPMLYMAWGLNVNNSGVCSQTFSSSSSRNLTLFKIKSLGSFGFKFSASFFKCHGLPSTIFEHKISKFEIIEEGHATKL